MRTIASSFADTVNYNLGNRSVAELLSSDEFCNELVNETDMEIIFSDGSKAKVIHEVPVKAAEVPSFKANPFVKVQLGSAIVYTNGCQEVFVKFLNCNKTLRMDCSADGEVNISGMGALKHYDGFQVKFR